MCKNDDVKKELHHLQQTFETNGYPPRLVQNVIRQRKDKTSPDLATCIKKEDQEKLLMLSYISGLSERIERATLPLNIKAVF